MKLSNYNRELIFSDKQHAIYNTLSSKYILYSPSQREFLDSLLNKLNKDVYEIEEGEALKKFIENGMIVHDDIDELEKVSYLMNKTKYQDRIFFLVIVPTLNCNFRCSYCYEERKDLRMNDQIIENIVDYVRKVSKKIKMLHIAWFGGEPMLEYETIKKLTKRFQEICDNEGCNYNAKMTSNGYLFTEERINELEDLGIKSIQITLDGEKEYHNKSRPLKDGSGTFDKILDNINKIAEKNIQISLRINLDKENKDSIPMLLERIPEEKRKNIEVSISNVFQNKKKENQFALYKTAIDKGYRFSQTKNSYSICQASFTNSFTVQPDGKITSCQMASEKGLHFGTIEKNGELNITNGSSFTKSKYLTALSNEKCRECYLLPKCIGGCHLGQYENNSVCITKKRFDGMNFEDLARLHIYHDLANDLVKEANVL
ncbi:radical SAM protein [Wukongibacter sp. M2B1]|uniref:radical SAM protein n=1 Tax=Wukongibacter sp. M2B1 TaxID=3088895 RepID=UPI003D799530